MRTWTIVAVVMLTLLVAACGGGRVAEVGDTVSVHYTGTLDSGEVFDSSQGRDPLTFTIGDGRLIADFDAAVRGLAVGKSVTVRLDPAQAYGEIDETLIVEFPRDEAPEGIALGDRLGLSTGGSAEVIEITGDVVRLDRNHPFAGKTLTFEIELVSIGE